jgi:multidrug efflux pump subunit AcrB
MAPRFEIEDDKNQEDPKSLEDENKNLLKRKNNNFNNPSEEENKPLKDRNTTTNQKNITPPPLEAKINQEENFFEKILKDKAKVAFIGSAIIIILAITIYLFLNIGITPSENSNNLNSKIDKSEKNSFEGKNKTSQDKIALPTKSVSTEKDNNSQKAPSKKSMDQSSHSVAQTLPKLQDQTQNPIQNQTQTPPESQSPLPSQNVSKKRPQMNQNMQEEDKDENVNLVDEFLNDN